MILISINYQLEYLQILISVILIFIKYSDVRIPSRLSWDVKEKAWLGQLIGQASDRAKPSPFASRMLKSSFWPWDWNELPISFGTTSAEAVHWICKWFDFVKLRQCLNLGDELQRVAYKRDGLVHTAWVTDKSALSCRIVNEVNPEGTTQMFAPILRIRAWPSASISKMSTSARAWRCYLDPSFLS